ncbi:unnamed protein product [Paramecium pentaurelia]|uniref:Transmembrane protein n=1 Tax=Paramecium pentaurelia TaxID=43138 RepID=A0A8S1YGM8_9CILI|nr:unnamed protein product [Paramecium pentaurelia]
MYPKSQINQQQKISQKPSTSSTQQQPFTMKSAKKESQQESHPKSQTQNTSLKIPPLIGDVHIAAVTLSNHPNPDIVSLINEEKKIQINNRINPQSSKLSCFKKKPDPILSWDHHQEKQLYSEFLEFIESRFKEVQIRPNINKYYAKIGLQVFIYFLNLLEIFFTLGYSIHNQDLGIFFTCYITSILLTIFSHSLSWMYSFKLRQIVKKNIFLNLPYYLFYSALGVLSYFKISPFIYYFNRNQSLKEFSFSEINKYLILDGEDKFRNPLRLLKKRTKPVNIFRELIFHRLSVLSMIITLCLQTAPQLFIQGFFNSKMSRWDGYNVVSYIILIVNLIYYLLELQFVVLTTTSRFMQTELQFKLKKIKLKYFKETKQLLKADQKQIGFIKSFYFHIDSSKLSTYEKNVCMVYIITFLTRYKKMQNIQFNFIDCYDEIALQYLANCLKLIQVQTISLLYHDQHNLGHLESIFQKQDFPNLILQFQDEDSIDALWDADQIDINEEEEKIQQILYIENPKINSGWQAVQHNYFVNFEYIKLSEHFIKVISKEQQPSIKASKGSPEVDKQQNQETIKQNLQESPEQIVQEAQAKITVITKRALFEEFIGKFSFLLIFYDCYIKLSQLNECQASLQSIYSITNGLFQFFSLVYIISGQNDFSKALLVLTLVHPILQLISFGVFQSKVFRGVSIAKQAFYIFLYGFFNFFKIWDIIMIVLYLAVKKFADQVRREFSAEGYLKFKNYASKFEGSLPISVFSYKAVQIDPKNIMQIKKQPFYQAVIWVTDVQEALNKLPQFYIYLLAFPLGQIYPIFGISFTQQIKESYISIKQLLEVFIQDFFIPALILCTVSVEQFLQSMLYFNSITNQMKLEYPKSFSILSKANERFIKEKCNLKINIKTLDFSSYKDLKREKILAQVRVVLASIDSILEIDEAQRIFCMGSEINDFIRCLIVSPIYQLKLNFYLDEVDPHHIHYTNAIMQFCPSKLHFLQVYVEATEIKNMQFQVGRQDSLKAFSYSYFQIVKVQKFNPLLRQKKNSKSILEIKEEFLHLDRYNFEQFYFEVSGNLGLSQCHEFLTKFTEMKYLKLSLYNKADIQTFEFQRNIKSQLDVLDITFENIRLDFQEFSFKTLKTLKMILKKCEFEKANLIKILASLNFEDTKEVYIDISQCTQNFPTIEQTELIRNLERKKIDVFIKI